MVQMSVALMAEKRVVSRVLMMVDLKVALMVDCLVAKTVDSMVDKKVVNSDEMKAMWIKT